MYIKIYFDVYEVSEEEMSDLNEEIKCSIFRNKNFKKLYYVICMLEFNKNKDKINEDKIKNDIIKFLKGGSVDGIEIDNTNEKYCSKDDLKIINKKFDYGDLSKLYLQWVKDKKYSIKVNVNLIKKLPIEIKYNNNAIKNKYKDNDNFLETLNEYLYKKRIRYQKRYLEDKKKEKLKKKFDDYLADNMLHNESQMSEDELSIYKLALKKNINLYKCKDKDNKFINWTKATYMADPMILSNAYEKARMYLKRHGDYKKVEKFSPILEKKLYEIKNTIDSNKKIDSNDIDEIVDQLTQGKKDKNIFNFKEKN